MPLVPTILSDELAKLENTQGEDDFIEAFVSAWQKYFDGATVTAIPINVGTYQTALDAMKTAMSGVSNENMFSLTLQNSITVFWTEIIKLGPTLWTIPPSPVTLITAPAAIATIKVTLDPILISNIALTKELAWLNIATTLHGLQMGSVVTLTPPPPAVPIVTTII